jgi:hypothetical protein
VNVTAFGPGVAWEWPERHIDLEELLAPPSTVLSILPTPTANSSATLVPAATSAPSITVRSSAFHRPPVESVPRWWQVRLLLPPQAVLYFCFELAGVAFVSATHPVVTHPYLFDSGSGGRPLTHVLRVPRIAPEPGVSATFSRPSTTSSTSSSRPSSVSSLSSSSRPGSGAPLVGRGVSLLAPLAWPIADTLIGRDTVMLHGTNFHPEALLFAAVAWPLTSQPLASTSFSSTSSSSTSTGRSRPSSGTPAVAFASASVADSPATSARTTSASDRLSWLPDLVTRPVIRLFNRYLKRLRRCFIKYAYWSSLLPSPAPDAGTSQSLKVSIAPQVAISLGTVSWRVCRHRPCIHACRYNDGFLRRMCLCMCVSDHRILGHGVGASGIGLCCGQD